MGTRFSQPVELSTLLASQIARRAVEEGKTFPQVIEEILTEQCLPSYPLSVDVEALAKVMNVPQSTVRSIVSGEPVTDAPQLD